MFTVGAGGGGEESSGGSSEGGGGVECTVHFTVVQYFPMLLSEGFLYLTAG